MHGLARCALAALTICASASAAMAAGQVNIQDPAMAMREARVDAGGRLAVQDVPPSSFFHSPDVAVGGPYCTKVAAAPVGKILIVRQIRIVAISSRATGQISFFYSIPKCGSYSFVAADAPFTAGQHILTFDPGVVIPEDSALYALSDGVDAHLFVDGFAIAPSVAPLVRPTIQMHGHPLQR
jgi:hypothetical protein